MVRAQWTVLAYLAAANDLETAAVADIKEMERVGSRPGRMEVVVQVDRAVADGCASGDSPTARRYYITRGCTRRRITSPVLADLGQTNTGDPQVLEAFLAFGIRAYPAERCALVIWNHGSGVYVPEAKRAPPERIGFGLAYDDRSGDSLDTRELERVLATGHRLLGRKVDLVGMDACLMAMLEIAWQIRDHAGVMVGSEEIEPGTGWPYAAILRDLTARPSMGAAELATAIVRRYVQTYTRTWHGVTQSAIDLSRLDELVDAVDRLARVLLAAWPSVRGAVREARRRTLSFFDDHYVDLHHLATNLTAATGLAPVREACLAVVRIIEGTMARSPLVAEAHAGPRMDAARGLSIYFPAAGEPWPFYRELDFARRTRWADFLDAHRNAPEIPRPESGAEDRVMRERAGDRGVLSSEPCSGPGRHRCSI